MREKLEKYIKKPSAKLYAELTSEEQRHLDRIGKGPKGNTKVDAKAKSNADDKN